MLAVQLELFGGPPKPPAKIREDEPVLPTDPKTVKILAETSETGIDLSSSSSIAVPILESLQDSKSNFEDAENGTTGIHILMPDTKPTQQVVTVDLNRANTNAGLSPIDTPAFEQKKAEKQSPEGLDTQETNGNLQELAISEFDSEAQIQAISKEPAEFMQLEQVRISEAIPQDAEAETTYEDTLLSDKKKEIEPDSTPSAPEELIEKTIGEVQGSSVPDRDVLYKRQYYTMRETADMFGVNQSLLRYWENEFTQLKPRKNRKGDRYFRPQDIESLQLIFHLLKVRKFTIEGAKEYLKQNKRALDTFELVQKLEKLKTFLLEIRTNL